jgi:hypothetical protein
MSTWHISEQNCPTPLRAQTWARRCREALLLASMKPLRTPGWRGLRLGDVIHHEVGVDGSTVYIKFHTQQPDRKVGAPGRRDRLLRRLFRVGTPAHLVALHTEFTDLLCGAPNRIPAYALADSAPAWGF